MINYNDIHLSVESDASRFLNGVKMCKETVGQPQARSAHGDYIENS